MLDLKTKKNITFHEITQLTVSCNPIAINVLY